jgi:hypothetical protein
MTIPSLSDVQNYVEGNINYFLSQPSHIQEQIELRKFMCHSCLSNKSCPHCGCPTPKMFYAPSKVDKLGRWAEFLSESQ